MTAWRLDSEVFADLRRTCALAGVEAHTEAEAREAERQGDTQAARWRTCVHEAGHAVVALMLAVSFSHVGIVPAPGGGGYLAHVGPYAEPREGGESRPLSAALTIGCAGAVAELLVLGAVDAVGAWRDLRRAFALAGVMHPGRASEGDEGVGAVKAAVAEARTLLVGERGALRRIAKALQDQYLLTRTECVELAGRKQRSVPAPRYEPVPTPDEGARLRAVRAELDAIEACRRVPV